MKWTTYSAIFGTVLIVVAIAAKLSGLGTAEISEPNEPDPDEGFISFMIDKKFPDLDKGLPVYEYQDGSRLMLYREPNEPSELIISCSCDWTYEIQGKELAYRSVYTKVTNINEPNEPMKYSLPIPTWPDYIELEKELEIELPYKIWYGRMAFENFIFPKGTKIYFKED